MRAASIAIGEQREERLGNGGTVANGDEEAGLAVFDRFGRTAGAAGDARLSRQRGFDVHERTWLAARGQRHHVDRVHQVGHVAAEAEEANVVHNASLLGNIVQLAPQLALADDPELRFRQFAQHGGHRGEQLAMALLSRQMSERADDRRVGRRRRVRPGR